MKFDVTLSWTECTMAGIVGLWRWNESRVHSRVPDQGSYAEALIHDVFGAMGEAALAKKMGRFWLGEWLNHRAPDVATDDNRNVQVRWTKYSNGHLLIQRRDDPAAYYVLVTGEPPTFTVCGWYRGEQAQQECYWGTGPRMPRPCFAVPQEHLNAFEF